MITIRFDGFTMEAIGHAGYAEKGQDIVCAGASSLFFAAAEYLMQMQKEGKLEKLEVLMMPGNVKLCCMANMKWWKEASHIFRFLEIGCRQLAEGYPDNVTVVSTT